MAHGACHRCGNAFEDCECSFAQWLEAWTPSTNLVTWATRHGATAREIAEYLESQATYFDPTNPMPSETYAHAGCFHQALLDLYTVVIRSIHGEAKASKGRTKASRARRRPVGRAVWQSDAVHRPEKRTRATEPTRRMRKTSG